MPIRITQKAFSLVELIVVITIIAIVAAISFSSLTMLQKNSRDAARQTDLRLIQGALQQFYADNNFYPNTMASGAALNNCTGSGGCTTSKTYLQIIPTDPTVGTITPYCYTSRISSVASSGNCTSGNAGKCHFYRLNAKLENPDSSAGSYTCGSSNVTGYNLEITPL